MEMSRRLVCLLRIIFAVGADDVCVVMCLKIRVSENQFL